MWLLSTTILETAPDNTIDQSKVHKLRQAPCGGTSRFFGAGPCQDLPVSDRQVEDKKQLIKHQPRQIVAKAQTAD